MSRASALSGDVLALDPERETRRIVAAMREQTRGLRRRGVVLGLSGGLDSSVTAALAVRALQPHRVLALIMPERESAPDSLSLAREVAASLGLDATVEEITPLLEAADCYGRRDRAMRRIHPAYGEGWTCKIALRPLRDGPEYRIFRAVARAPDGREVEARLDAEAYHAVVAATNFKQRTRKMIEYYHADRLRFAVAGTPNRLEYELGFFVKNGDGAADLLPIAHLYKTQVYRLAEFLGIPESIRRRPPTTDTYPMEQSQEEFFFAMPLHRLDLCLYGSNHGAAVEDVASVTGMTREQVALVYADIVAKRRSAEYLHRKPLPLAEC